MDDISKRLQAVETATPNDASTSTTPTTDLSSLQADVKALDTRVTALMGKAHKDSLSFPGGQSIHNICNRIELHRKRLHDVEEVKGASKLVKMLTGKNTRQPTKQSPPITKTPEAQPDGITLTATPPTPSTHPDP